MRVKYHGNWCGPGWSDGDWVDSRKGYAPAIDEFDETCRQHDFALASGARNREADRKFVESNLGKGAKRTLAAVAVAARDYIQTFTDKPQIQIKMTKSKKQNKNLRGTPDKATNTVPTMKKNDEKKMAPVSIATRRTGSKPVIKNVAGGVTIAHRSFLFPVTNSLNFDVDAVPCNPGLSGSFPWLAKLARRYEQYRFKKLKYEFRSVAASSQSGVIMMSFDYDAADSAPATKAEQAQTVPNSETNVWMNNDLIVKPDSNWHFVRAGTLGANLDVKTYDMGNLWISSAYGNNVVGGELYVEYEVELRRPTDGPEVCGRFSCDTGAFNAPVNATNATVTGAAFPFVRTSNTDLTVTAGGEYIVCFEVNGTVMTGAAPLPTIATGSTTSVATSLFNVVGASNTCRVFRLRVDTGDILTFANAGTGATISNTRVYVGTVDYLSLQ
jgi:hypothetical protein